MALPASVEALRNDRTGKLFIVLEYGANPNRVKVINPNGDVLDVATIIFDMENPVQVVLADFSAEFSSEQLTQLELYADQERERIRLQANRPSNSDNLKSSTRVVPTRRKARETSESSSPRRGHVVTWESDFLVFYRHHIEPLKPNDAFAVRMPGVGTLQMTKAEFQRVFNNVVMASSYRVHGMFKYDIIPDEAKPFIRS